MSGVVAVYVRSPGACTQLDQLACNQIALIRLVILFLARLGAEIEYIGIYIAFA